MTRKEEIVEVLNGLGGQATLSEIVEGVKKITVNPIPKTIAACIRREIENRSSDSMNYLGKEDIFYSVKGIGKGVWGLRDPKITEANMDITQDDENFSEGRKVLKQHIVRERNHALIEKAKENFKKLHGGKLYCEVCGFNFEDKYGPIGKEFIEAHHIKPVSSLKPGEKTNVKDLIMVCSNCHSMIHRRKPWLTKKQLKKLLKT